MKTVSASRPGVAVFFAVNQTSTASVLYYVHCAVPVIFSCTCQYANGSEAVCVVANRELPKRTLLFIVLSLEGRPAAVCDTRAYDRKQYVYPPTKTMVHRDRFARWPAAIALAQRSSVSFSHAVRTPSRHGRTDGRSDERASERAKGCQSRSIDHGGERITLRLSEEAFSRGSGG